MKSEDLKRLQQICDENGFEIGAHSYDQYGKGIAYSIIKKPETIGVNIVGDTLDYRYNLMKLNFSISENFNLQLLTSTEKNEIKLKLAAYLECILNNK